MIKRMLGKDLQRNKIIALTLFLFILLSAALVSGALQLIVQLNGSLDGLFEQAGLPHFLQMHSGELDVEEIEAFARDNDLVEEWQLVELLNVNGTDLAMGNRGRSEADSVMENSFVRQNRQFDFLLDMNNQILQIEPGEVAVPVHYLKEYGLSAGEEIRVETAGYSKTFTIVSFARDAQMNPSLVTSKRFLISDEDWSELRSNLGELEYIVEFRLSDSGLAAEFENQYISAGLPQAGASVTYSLFKLLNGLSDGLVAAVVVLIAALLIAIAALCLRLTLLSAMEEDYREIGALKAIGASSRQIQRIYLVKYVFLATAACIAGYILSFPAGTLLSSNIVLYMGITDDGNGGRLIALAGALAVWGVVVLLCTMVLRKFRKVSAVEAIRFGSSSLAAGKSRKKNTLRLSTSRFPNVNVFLGIKETVGNMPQYGLLCLVFAICSFLMILPVNFHSTVHSPDFITYMGAGRSDIRIDLQLAGDMAQRFEQLVNHLGEDAEVERYAAFVTNAYRVLNEEGEYETIKVETGDFSVFPLEYLSGQAPQAEDEIALSSMNSQELAKGIGDQLILYTEEGEKVLRVCGIYQDVTNGGKTAKARFSGSKDSVLWYVVNLDLVDGVTVTDKIVEYRDLFYPAKVTSLDDYVIQTLGSITGRLELGAKIACFISLAMAVLITALYFKMMTAKEKGRIAVMSSLGLTFSDIQVQYITRMLLVLLAGVVLGTLAAATIGEQLAGLMLMGVARLSFVTDPLTVYLLYPLLLTGAVLATIFFSGKSIRIAGDLRKFME